jgi:catechol 2,3-dioxygenase-like lactoylglutathione lyase family enzyme
MIVAMVALLVREYDEAIAFYRDAFGFRVVEDTPMAHKRWIRMRAGEGGAELVLSRALGDQAAVVGKQAGGRVFLFVHTADFDADLARMRAANVVFTEAPRVEAYGRVVVVEDLYGNRVDVIERR